LSATARTIHHTQFPTYTAALDVFTFSTACAETHMAIDLQAFKAAEQESILPANQSPLLAAIISTFTSTDSSANMPTECAVQQTTIQPTVL
jgi:hypothetical protein